MVLADLQLEKTEAEAEQLRQKGFDATAAALDVSDITAVESFFEVLGAEPKRVDILVNSAGVGQKVGPVVELSQQEWDRVLRVTLTGTFLCCRSAGAIMERQESGSIVNLASINGQNPAALVAAYVSEEEMIERVRAAVPLGRWGEPTDIASAVAFLCSPDAAWITGEILRVSGGMEGVSAAPPRRSRIGD